MRTRKDQKQDQARFAELLQQAGIRPTRQRLALAGILFRGPHQHLTAEQVYAAARKSRAPMSLATVYNNLNQFRKAGLLSEIALDQGQSYYDTNTDAHYHVYDTFTGTLRDIPLQSLQLSNLPAPPPGRRIAGVDITIRLAKTGKT